MDIVTPGTNLFRTIPEQHFLHAHIHKLKALAASDNNVSSDEIVVIEDDEYIPWICELKSHLPDYIELDRMRVKSKNPSRYDDPCCNPVPDDEDAVADNTEKIFLPRNYEDWGGHLAINYKGRVIHILSVATSQNFSASYSWTYMAAGPGRDIIESLLMELNQIRYGIRKDQIKKNIFNGSDFLTPRPNADWDSLVLPKGMKEKIETNVESFFKAKKLYHDCGLPYRRGILMVGEPGNGKTTAIRILASKYRDYAFFLYGFSTGEEEVKERIIQTFKDAQEFAPAIVVLEDVDRLVKGNFMRTFLNMLDGMVPQEGVLVIATSNKPEELDPALTERPSRFDIVLRFDKPDREQREDYINKVLAPKFTLTSKDVQSVVNQTDGYSMAMLQEIHAGALLLHVRASKPFDFALIEASIKNINESRRIIKSAGGPKTSVPGFGV